MDFVALDVETANADLSSICQIGIAGYENAMLVEEWKSYIDPEDFFDPVNVSVHGIDEQTVAGAPCLPDVAHLISTRLSHHVIVCHTHFDRLALLRAFERYGLEAPNSVWLDSARVARRAWTQFARRGYGIESVCAFIGYDFKYHDALEDAKAAAHVLIAATQATGLTVTEWLARVEQPIFPSEQKKKSVSFAREGNPDGPLFGEVVVFTGALQMPRREAADLAASLGCRVTNGVTKETTMLVVGNQDVRRLAGHDKSSKHRKAESLIATGQAIRILRESDFLRLADARP